MCHYKQSLTCVHSLYLFSQLFIVTLQHFILFPFGENFFNLYWNIVALQYCNSFCCRAKEMLSYICIHISFWDLTQKSKRILICLFSHSFVFVSLPTLCPLGKRGSFVYSFTIFFVCEGGKSSHLFVLYIKREKLGEGEQEATSQLLFL